MTLRATKADVDLFAKGQLNQTQFEAASAGCDLLIRHGPKTGDDK